MVRLAVAVAMLSILGVAATRKAYPSNVGYRPVEKKGAPFLIAPLDGWVVTDIALSFRWQRLCNDQSSIDDGKWTTGSYQLQVSTASGFTSVSLDHTHTVGYGHSAASANRKKYTTEAMYMPTDAQLLGAGSYYWRVRVAADGATGVAAGPWSATSAFSVSSDRSTVTTHAQRRPLSSANPLFTFDLYESDAGGWGSNPNFESVYNYFPPEVKPYVALAVPHEYWSTVGEDSTKDSAGNQRVYFDFLRAPAEAQVPMVIKTGGPDGVFDWYLDPAQLEHLLQTVPSLYGLVVGEMTWSYFDALVTPAVNDMNLLWYRRIVQICEKYGAYVIMGEGSYAFSWDRLFSGEWLPASFMATYTNTIIPCPKTNIIWSYFQADSVVFGSWLGGATANFGLWAEAWYWSDAGFQLGPFKSQQQSSEDADFTKQPIAFWVQSMLVAMSKGAAVYHFGGESSVSENRGYYDYATDQVYETASFETVYTDYEAAPANAYSGDYYPSFWDMHGSKTKGFDKYIVPFIRAAAAGAEPAIPTKSDVLAAVKIAVDPGSSWPPTIDGSNFYCYSTFATLYTNTYGIRDYTPAVAQFSSASAVDSMDEPEEQLLATVPNGCKYEQIPNTGRYYSIPIIPQHYPSFSAPSTLTVVSLNDLQSASQVQSTFNGAYPNIYSGDAWTILVGRSLFVQNNYENTNTAQTYGATLGGGSNGGIVSIAGTVLPFAYIFGTVSSDGAGITLHANAALGVDFTDSRRAVFTTTWGSARASAPSITTSPSNALVGSTWNPGTRTLAVQLAHSVSEGAVDITIGSASSSAGGGGTQTVPPSPPPTPPPASGERWTCAQLGWPIKNSVCGESDSKLGNGGASSACNTNANLTQASAICTAAGSRLCTVDEIDAGTTATTGCGFDSQYIWTSTWCGLGPEGGKVYVSMGSGSGERKCKNPKKPYPTRCCSDVSLTATTALPATTSTTFPFLSERKSCAALAWEVTGNACGESDKAFKKGLDKCFTWKNHPDAERKCLKLGGRMCSQADIEAGVGKSTGCGFDSRFLWTSTPCGINSYVQAKGDGSGGVVCAIAKSKGPMRCCSDVNL